LNPDAQSLTIRLTYLANGRLIVETVTLSSKGQLVIPKAVREHMGAKAGAIFAVRYADGELHLKPVEARPPSSLDEVAGFLARPGRKPLTEAQTRAAIRTRLKARNAP
jgi:AbrB family looped-hinge helix DNA binding protein